MPAVRRELYKETFRIEPFYSGGPICVTRDDSAMFCFKDNILCCVDLKTSTIIKKLELDGEILTSMAMTEEGETLYVSSRALQIYQIEVATVSVLTSWRAHDAPILSMSVSKDGKLICSGSVDGWVRLHSTKTRKCVFSNKSYQNVVTFTQFSEMGNSKCPLFCSLSADGKACLHTAKDTLVFAEHKSGVASATFTEGNKLMLSGHDGSVSVWDVSIQAGKPVAQKTRVVAAYDSFARLERLSKGGLVAALNMGKKGGGFTVLKPNGSVQTNVATGHQYIHIPGHKYEASCATEEFLYVASDECLIKSIRVDDVGNEQDNDRAYQTYVGSYGSANELCVVPVGVDQGHPQELAIVTSPSNGISAFLVAEDGSMTPIPVHLQEERPPSDSEDKTRDGGDEEPQGDPSSSSEFGSDELDEGERGEEGDDDDVTQHQYDREEIGEDGEGNEEDGEDRTICFISSPTSWNKQLHQLYLKVENKSEHKALRGLIAVGTADGTAKIMAYDFDITKGLTLMEVCRTQKHNNAITTICLFVNRQRESALNKIITGEDSCHFPSAILSVGDNAGFLHTYSPEKNLDAFCAFWSDHSMFKRYLPSWAKRNEAGLHKLPAKVLSITATRASISNETKGMPSVVMAVGCEDKRLHIVLGEFGRKGIITTREIQALEGHKRSIWQVRFANGVSWKIDGGSTNTNKGRGQALVTAATDGTCRLWEASSTSSGVASAVPVGVLQGHLGGVIACDFVGHGDVTSQIVSCATDGLLKLWDSQTRECISTLNISADDRDNTTAQPVALSSIFGGKHLLLSLSDGGLVLVSDKTEEVQKEKEEQREKELQFNLSLNNALRDKQFTKALCIVFRNDMGPLKNTKLLSKVLMETYNKGEVPEKDIGDAVKEINLKTVKSIIATCLKLSTTSRGCVLIQDLILAIFSKYGIDVLCKTYAEDKHFCTTVVTLASNMHKHLNRIMRLQIGMQEARPITSELIG